MTSLDDIALQNEPAVPGAECISLDHPMTMPGSSEAPVAVEIKEEAAHIDHTENIGVENHMAPDVQPSEQRDNAHTNAVPTSHEISPSEPVDENGTLPIDSSVPASHVQSEDLPERDQDSPGEATEEDLPALGLAAAPLVLTSRPEIDPSVLPVLSPLITRRDISRRELPLSCHVDGCSISLNQQAEYYQRYRICKEHLRSPALLVDGVPQRFCQQCGRFHELDAFDGDKRNCRARLAQHNSRRRKAGAAPGVLPYGHGQTSRRRTTVSYDRYDGQFDYEFDDGRRSQRARTATARDVSHGTQHTAGTSTRRQKVEDVGFLDQLVAAATGMEEEEAAEVVAAQNTMDYRPEYEDAPPAPLRVVAKPARGDNNKFQPQQADQGYYTEPIRSVPRYSSQFGGWPAGLNAYGNGQAAAPPAPNFSAPPPAAVSELEQLLGRQLIQGLLAGAGLQFPGIAPAPLPPMMPPQSGNPLLDALRSMAGMAPPAGAAAPLGMPSLTSNGSQFSFPSQFRVTPVPPPPPSLASQLGGDGFSRLGAASNALDALKQLVSCFPGNAGAGTAVPSSNGAERQPSPSHASAGQQQPTSPNRSRMALMEQLAAALKAQGDAAAAPSTVPAGAEDVSKQALQRLATLLKSQTPATGAASAPAAGAEATNSPTSKQHLVQQLQFFLQQQQQQAGQAGARGNDAQEDA